MKRGWKSTAAYAGLLAAVFLAAVLGSMKFGAELDNYAYDYMFRLYDPPPWQTHSAILAIDERSLQAYGGIHSIRQPLADALRLVASAGPKSVAIDVILADPGDNPHVDRALAEALRATPNLVLASELLSDGWGDPQPEFARAAAALGHVYGQPGDDGITRAIALEKRFRLDRRWALPLEAFRLSRGAPYVLESPGDLQVGGAIVPVPQKATGASGSVRDDSRIMRIRFVPFNMPPIPRIGMKALLDDPARARAFAGKVVFVGLTALTEVHDRLLTPIAPAMQMSGIEVNANAFETMAQGLYITDVGDHWVLLFSLALAVAAGLAFRYLPGWWAYGGGLLVLAASNVAPYVFFVNRRVFSFATPASAAWFCTLAAAAYYHLVVRRNWRIEQAARTRYQQAMQFVTHEMRTPLSAIQGSSELISRYSLTEEKRKQIADLINSESKRLARMVEVFLSVERLSAGQMELKRESIGVKQMIAICAQRAAPLAARKHITLLFPPVAEDLQLSGDRELMEYACYNLLTNAIKYSPQRTEVTVSARAEGGSVRIAVEDHGIGMDQKEVKQIFQKFYRTRKAEESGEAGTGIGLSIVHQIVEQHGGRIEVESQPGAGSCFTLVLPGPVGAPAPATEQSMGVAERTQ
jgi:signal transduction histidine kinase